MRLRPATDADRAAWQALLGATASGDFLHDWAWADVAAFDGQPQRRFVLEEEGQLVGLAAAQVRALPMGRAFWYVPHGPVIDYGDPAAGERLRAMVLAMREAGRHGGALAVKLEPRIAHDDPMVEVLARLPVRRERASVQVGQTRLVELLDDDALLAAFDKDTRYGVRRAERGGVRIRRITDVIAGGASRIDFQIQLWRFARSDGTQNSFSAG